MPAKLACARDRNRFPVPLSPASSGHSHKHPTKTYASKTVLSDGGANPCQNLPRRHLGGPKTYSSVTSGDEVAEAY